MRWLIAVLLVGGCQTQFTGDPHIDPATCVQKCRAAQLEMSGIVYMGEYSSACICEVPRPPGAAPAPPSVPGSGGAGAGAAAGVVMQMRAAAAQQRH